MADNNNALEREKNIGGFGGGAEYLGMSLLNSVVSSVEGLADLLVGTYIGTNGAALEAIGVNNPLDDIANYTFMNDWYNYGAAAEKYNPDGWMKFTGDLVSGLGSTLISAIPVVGPALGIGSAIGRGITDVSQVLGKVTPGAVGAGLFMGAVATALEIGTAGIWDYKGFNHVASGWYDDFVRFIGRNLIRGSDNFLLGVAKGAINSADNVLGGVLKGTANSMDNVLGGVLKGGTSYIDDAVAATTKGGIINSIIKKGVVEGTSEFIEEFGESVAEDIAKGFVIEDYEHASIGDHLYSGFIGGIVGGGLGSVEAGINAKYESTVTNIGDKLSQKQSIVDSILKNAKSFVEFMAQNDIDTDLDTKEDEGKSSSSSKGNTKKDSKNPLINNKIEEYYTALTETLKLTDGKITSAAQKNLLGHLQAEISKTVINKTAINTAFRFVTNADTVAEQLNNFYQGTGSDIKINAEDITEGVKLDGDEDELVNSLSDALVNNETLRNLVYNSMTGQLRLDAKNYANSIFGNISIPAVATQENINRFLATADDATVDAVGDMLGIDNWATVTPNVLAAKLREFRDSGRAEDIRVEVEQAIAERIKANGGAANDSTPGRFAKLDQDIDRFAKNNIKEYNRLNAPEREVVREAIRRARANGLSVSDQTLIGRISATSGMDIVVVKKLPGSDKAFFDGRNSVYIDTVSPDSRTLGQFLGHELWHKIFKNGRAKKLFMMAYSRVDKATRAKVRAEYTSHYEAIVRSELNRDLNADERAQVKKIADEEIAAAYAERVFNESGAWDYVLTEEPSLAERVLNFFKGAEKRYSFDNRIPREARRWLAEYKRLFSELSRYNSGMAAVEKTVNSEFGIRNSELGEGSRSPEAEGPVNSEFGIRNSELVEGSRSPKVKVVGRINENSEFGIRNEEFGADNVQSGFNVTENAGSPQNKNQKSPKVVGRIDLTSMNSEKMQDSGRRSAIVKNKFSSYDEPITPADIQVLRSIGRKSVNAFADEEIKKAQKWAHKFYKELGVKSPFFRAWFGDWRAHDIKTPSLVTDVPQGVKINYKKRAITNEDTKWTIDVTEDLIQDSLHYAKKDRLYIERLLTHIDDVLEKAILLDSSVTDVNKSNKKPSSEFMHYLYAPIEYQGAPFLAKITVEEYDVDNKKRAYNAQRIKLSALSRAQYSQLKAAYRGKYASNADAISIADLIELVKTYDKDFTPAPEVSPLLLEDDGTPKVFYHGTRSKFTVFELQDKPAFGRALGDGFYFTSNHDKAFKFANGLFSKGQDRGGIIMPVYLRMKNPYVIEVDADRRGWVKEYNAGDYDGIIDLKNDTYYVEEQMQIKSVTDNIGTFSRYNPDIRYALKKSGSATRSDVKAVREELLAAGVNPRPIVEYVNELYERYGGEDTKTGLQYRLLSAAKLLASEESGGFDEAYKSVEDFSDEMLSNQKSDAVLTDELKAIRNSVKNAHFKVDERDRADFDIYGGFEAFRKRNFGKFIISKDGIGVDVLYGELQSEFGKAWFPDVNGAAEMLGQIADVTEKVKVKSAEKAEYTDAERDAFASEIFAKLGAIIEGEGKIELKKRLSPADAERYKAILAARSELKTSRATAKAETRARREYEDEAARIRAEYLTDTVFSPNTLSRVVNSVPEIKDMKQSERSEITRSFWLDLENSNHQMERNYLSIVYAQKYYDALTTDGGAYGNAPLAIKNELAEKIRDMTDRAVKIGQRSVRSQLEESIKSEHERRTNTLSRIYSAINGIKEDDVRRIVEAESYRSNEFKEVIKALKGIEWRGKLNWTIAKNNMVELSLWYNENNPMFEPGDKGATPLYNEAIAERLRILKESVTPGFTLNELEMLNDVVNYFAKFIREYDRVYVENKWQSGTELSKRFCEGIRSADEVSLPLRVRAFRNRLISGDAESFADPLSIMKNADLYDNGVFTIYYNELVNAQIEAEYKKLDIKREYDEFLKKNRKYLLSTEKANVNLYGAEISKQALIEYYMLLGREQAIPHIAYGGVVYRAGKNSNDVVLKPQGLSLKMSNKEILRLAKVERQNIYSMLDEKDKRFVKILERGYEKARVEKASGDMKRLGIVSVIKGYYYPIKSAYSEHLSEVDGQIFSVDRAAYASFNKHEIDEAKSTLRIGSAAGTFIRHINGVVNYNYLSPVVDSFNKLWKLKVVEGERIGRDMKIKARNSYTLETVSRQAKNGWNHNGLVGFNYLQGLMQDAMGVPPKAGGDDVAAMLRGVGVVKGLGANLKVLMTQTTSLIASTSILRPTSVISGGFSVWSNDMDTYCHLAELRNSDYTVAKAQGVVDGFNRASEFLMNGISAVDRFVVYRAWAACQVEVARGDGPKVGTVENKVKAGELLTKVILETQQNTISSRKTHAARRGNMLYKGLMMFKSDAVTLLGRVNDAFMKAGVLKKRRSNKDIDENEIEVIDREIKKTNKEFGKAVGAVVGVSAALAVISEAWSGLLGRYEGEDDEEKRERIFLDFLSNLFGGNPVYGEIVGMIGSHYDYEIVEYSVLNDLFKSVNDIYETAGLLFSGEKTSKDVAKIFGSIVDIVGTFGGIPVRNIKNLTTAAVRAVNKGAAYQLNALSKEPNYSSDFFAAIKSGDIELATVILELATKERLGSGLTSKAIDELVRLGVDGQNILPTEFSSTVKIGEENYKLSAEEYAAAKQIYSESTEAISRLISSEIYKSYDDETRAKAIRGIYEAYKDLAYDSVLGTERDTDAYLISKAIGAENVATYKALGYIESDKSANGKTISGSRKNKIVAEVNKLDIGTGEKLLMIAMRGFSLSTSEKRTLYGYIKGLRGLSDAERLALYSECGFAVMADGSVRIPTSSGARAKTIGKLLGGGTLGGALSNNGLSEELKITRIGKIVI